MVVGSRPNCKRSEGRHFTLHMMKRAIGEKVELPGHSLKLLLQPEAIRLLREPQGRHLRVFADSLDRSPVIGFKVWDLKGSTRDVSS